MSLSPESPMAVCVCGHTRMVHEPHCVVTYYAAQRACPSNCREFRLIPYRPEDTKGGE